VAWEFVLDTDVGDWRSSVITDTNGLRDTAPLLRRNGTKQHCFFPPQYTCRRLEHHCDVCFAALRLVFVFRHFASVTSRHSPTSTLTARHSTPPSVCLMPFTQLPVTWCHSSRDIITHSTSKSTGRSRADVLLMTRVCVGGLKVGDNPPPRG